MIPQFPLPLPLLIYVLGVLGFGVRAFVYRLRWRHPTLQYHGVRVADVALFTDLAIAVTWPVWVLIHHALMPLFGVARVSTWLRLPSGDSELLDNAACEDPHCTHCLEDDEDAAADDEDAAAHDPLTLGDVAQWAQTLTEEERKRLLKAPDDDRISAIFDRNFTPNELSTLFTPNELSALDFILACSSNPGYTLPTECADIPFAEFADFLTPPIEERPLSAAEMEQVMKYILEFPTIAECDSLSDEEYDARMAATLEGQRLMRHLPPIEQNALWRKHRKTSYENTHAAEEDRAE